MALALTNFTQIGSSLSVYVSSSQQAIDPSGGLSPQIAAIQVDNSANTVPVYISSYRNGEELTHTVPPLTSRNYLWEGPVYIKAKTPVTVTVKAYQDNASAASGVLTIGGVNFGDTTLQYYKEDVWTPTIVGADGNPTISGTVVGKYTRIGRMVFAEARFTNCTLSGGSGAASIGGLPIAANGSNYGAFPIALASGVSAKSATFVAGVLNIYDGSDNPISISGFSGGFYTYVIFNYFI